jgi:uncharacterized Zn-binding protein involved in type VI secretion
MPEAARLGDMHVCPVTVPTIHVGGPILPPCCPTVITGGQPQARVGDKAFCNGPPDLIRDGSPTVIIGNQRAARKGDPTEKGKIVEGCPTVLIGVPAECA